MPVPPAIMSIAATTTSAGISIRKYASRTFKSVVTNRRSVAEAAAAAEATTSLAPPAAGSTTSMVVDFYTRYAYSAMPAGKLWYADTELPSTQSTTEDPCGGYEEQGHLYLKLWLVALLGTILAILSIGENLLLLYMFATRVQFRASNLFYMMFLAFCDVFVSLSFICLMSVHVVAEYYGVLWLFLMWHHYLRPMFAISHIAMASSSFLIMSATFERCVTTATKWQVSVCTFVIYILYVLVCHPQYFQYIHRYSHMGTYLCR